jgi:hypothetical protein
MKVKCLLIGVVVLFAVGVLTASSYAKVDLKTCVGMWLFDEDKGDIVTDSSGNKNDGTLMGGPQWVDGKFGSALEFDGVDDCVDCGNAESLKAGAGLTITALIKTTDVRTAVGSEEYVVVHRIDLNAPYAGYCLGRFGNYAFFHLGEIYAGANILIGKTYVINDGAWHHIIGTYDGKTSKIYVDGKLDIEEAKKSNFDSNVNCQLGRDPWRWYQGLIDETAIFNVALNNDDIKRITNGGLEMAFAVSPAGKLAKTWANIKTRY